MSTDGNSCDAKHRVGGIALCAVVGILFASTFGAAAYADCRCIGNPGCPCLQGGGSKRERPDGIDYEERRKSRDNQQEPAEDEEARERALKRQRELEAQREQQRVRDNRRWLDDQLALAKQNAQRRLPARQELWSLATEADAAEIERRKDDLDQALAEARPDAPAADASLAASRANGQSLLYMLKRSWQEGVRPYDELPYAISALQHYALRSGDSVSMPVDALAITKRQVADALRSTRKYSFLSQIQDLGEGERKTIRFFQGISTTTLVNEYLFLGRITLEIEADATRNGSEVQLENVSVVGGCDVYAAHETPRVNKQPKKYIYETINSVLGAIPGRAYKVLFRGSMPLDDEVIAVPQADVDAPECVK
ncbi:MAG TPA: hypothetical protein VEI03_17450 [Stellaceae bacterium]|nr:hypothetical protein [Stellaceae bacterium]